MKSIAERHKYILDQLNLQGFVKVSDLAKELDVTVVTIRKDLKILEEKNLLYRTHGSASPINPHMADRNVTEKELLNKKEKNLIAAAAATELIGPNESIILNSGSTICTFAEKLKPQGALTVVTPSIKVAQLLGGQEGVRLIQLGGFYKPKSMSVTGSYAIDFLKQITSSLLFLGVDGIDPDYGVTTSNIEEAELNRAMIDVALKTIVLCDSSKFGKKGFGKICNLDQIDLVVTDSGITKQMVNYLEESGVRLLIVSEKGIERK